MNYTILKPWTAWMMDPQWVGGYITEFANNFTFITVRGAGHMAPQYEPPAAWTFFSRFINNEHI
jgi:serine carboxypeptidase-like clade 1